MKLKWIDTSDDIESHTLFITDKVYIRLDQIESHEWTMYSYMTGKQTSIEITTLKEAKDKALKQAVKDIEYLSKQLNKACKELL